MHKLIVFIAAAGLGMVGGGLLQALNSLTGLTLILCAVGIAAVAGFALLPNVTMRKFSLRRKHAWRKLRRRGSRLQPSTKAPVTVATR